MAGRMCVCRPAPAEVAVASSGCRKRKGDSAPAGLRLPEGWRRAEAAEMTKDCASIGVRLPRWPWRSEAAEMTKTTVRLAACAKQMWPWRAKGATTVAKTCCMDSHH